MDDLFYEIEYDSRPLPDVEPIPGVGRFVLKPRAEKDESAEIRALFHKMRELARVQSRSLFDSLSFYGAIMRSYDSETFYKQGMFMKDFSDDYEGESKPFSEYYPRYQMMGYEQLRTYFTWRTGVRNGKIQNTSLSYAFVYIYELLNNIGCDNPSDALDKLLLFWKAFRVYDETLDRYVLKWLKDYHDYYELQGGFMEFAVSNRLQPFYPEYFLCDSDDLDVWNKISSYNITKSRFYNDGNETLMKEAFEYVIRKLRKRVQFKELVFEPVNFDRDPFNGAMFFNRLNKTIQMKRLFVTDSGKQIVGYIIKYTEVLLRKITKYKYKIKAVLPNLSGTILGAGLEQNIERAVAGYYADINRVEVKVDLGNLERIREEALGTQEKLVVPGESETIIPSETEHEEVTESITEDISDEWASLKSELGEIELKALSTILHGESIKNYAAGCNIMPEVLIDGINEKSTDLVGDNLIDDDFILYDDYIEKAKELVE